MTTGSAAEGAGDAPLASPGARWTREEDEELVAAVRAGADLAVIAEQRGRTRGAIVSRLLRMIPAREDFPEEEQLGWIMARLADPCFDWRTPFAHPRPGKRGSGAPATPPASDVGEVLHDGTLDQNSVMAIAELSFPGARPENVAQVIMHIADAPAAARREPGRREAESKGPSFR